MQIKSKEQVVEQFRIETIRDAALRVIARKGIAGASMQEIAEEAGIAKGTIYLYFKNQQEVLEAAIDAAIQQLHATLLATLHSSGPFRERFRRLMLAHLEFFDTHRDLFRVHMAAKYPDGVTADAARCDRSARPCFIDYLNNLAQFLEEGMEAGEIRTMDARRLATFLEEGLLSVLMQRLQASDNPPLEAETEWLTSLIFDGISLKRRSRS